MTDHDITLDPLWHRAEQHPKLAKPLKRQGEIEATIVELQAKAQDLNTRLAHLHQDAINRAAEAMVARKPAPSAEATGKLEDELDEVRRELDIAHRAFDLQAANIADIFDSIRPELLADAKHDRATALDAAHDRIDAATTELAAARQTQAAIYAEPAPDDETAEREAEHRRAHDRARLLTAIADVGHARDDLDADYPSPRASLSKVVGIINQAGEPHSWHDVLEALRIMALPEDQRIAITSDQRTWTGATIKGLPVGGTEIRS